MQKPTLSIRNKTRLLLALSIITIVISIPLGFETIDYSDRGYYSLHVVSVIFGMFLSIVGILTYLEFRKTRLLMVFAAFSAITIAESSSLANMVYPFFETSYDLHDYLMHGLILAMLSFFMIGIFRSD